MSTPQTLTLILIILLLLTLLFLTLYVSTLLKKQKLEGTLELREETLKEREERHRSELRLRDEALRSQREAFEKAGAAQEDRFKALSEEITKRRSEELTETNRVSMDALLTPLKETIAKMERSLRETSEGDAKRAGELERAMKEMSEKSIRVGLQADALAAALTSRPKLQGNWGEEQLRVLFEEAGLTEGLHYDEQVTLKDDSGSAFRPDFIVHFPENRDVIIDSKVSLTAYARYMAAETEEERAACAKANYDSITKHIGELTSKKYQNLGGSGRKALEQVIMFVPIPGALLLAYQTESGLWNEALKQNVLLASQQNLMVLLRIISLSWRQETQMKNFREMTLQAAKLIEAGEEFVKRMNTVRQRFSSLDAALKDMERKMTGRQGVLYYARTVSELAGKESAKLIEATEEKTVEDEAETDPMDPQ